MSTPRQRQIEKTLEWLDNANDLATAPGLARGRWMSNVSAWVSGGGGLLAAWPVTKQPDPAAKMMSAIPIVHRPVTLQNVRTHDGRLTADDIVFRGVTNVTLVGIVIADNHRQLPLAYVPFPAPLVANGSDITIMWHREHGIFGVV